MKQFSASWLKRAAAAAEIVSEDELKASLRDRFLAADGDKPALARALGITPNQLTRLLRGQRGICDGVAAALGYRKVIRFERVE